MRNIDVAEVLCSNKESGRGLGCRYSFEIVVRGESAWEIGAEKVKQSLEKLLQKWNESAAND